VADTIYPVEYLTAVEPNPVNAKRSKKRSNPDADSGMPRAATLPEYLEDIRKRKYTSSIAHALKKRRSDGTLLYRVKGVDPLQHELPRDSKVTPEVQSAYYAIEMLRSTWDRIHSIVLLLTGQLSFFFLHMLHD
jgi:hypothetical protein